MNPPTYRAALAAALALTSTAVRAQDGYYDQSWVYQGTMLYSPSGHPSDFGGAIAVQSSGRFIVAGDCWRNNAPGGICVGALLPNGHSDNGHFAGYPLTAGFVLPDFPEFPGDYTFAFHGLAIQADDRIVLASRTTLTNGASASRLIRLGPNGETQQLDNGLYYRTVEFRGADNSANAVAIAPDGKIVVAGSSVSATADMGVARFNGADLTPDTGFGENGGAVVAFDQGGDNFDVAKAVAVQGDGKIVVAGWVRGSGGGADIDGGIARLNADGSLDASFGNGGKALLTAADTFGSGANFNINAVAVDRRGGIVVAGSVERFDLAHHVTDFFVARFDADGHRDAGFAPGNPSGHAGVAVFPDHYTDPWHNEAYGLLIAGNGNILAYGYASSDQQAVPASHWAMLQLKPNGDPAAPQSFTTSYGNYANSMAEPASNDARGAVVANGALFVSGRSFNYGSDAYFGIGKLVFDHVFADGFEP